MLKRLELVGFKSFADKTTFDFSAGITGIVGPNGSGKSNIVDAVRWILGEQSAKSLRGGEMADVIFNGSSGRRSFGMAEVTMTFDNCRRTLNADQDEVQITRRVYRESEGEYLINQLPSRLKDIRDLFLGSGAGADAYCIIEQGRVDVLLQASTRERRTIFEEAAGISRFKARKTETLRKLERVDQNLSRVRDIIAEVEKQLRGVRLQAAKAQRHQEYSARLRELRVTLSLQEYRHLTEQLDAESTVLEQLRHGLEERAGQVESLEEQTRGREQSLAELDSRIHGEEEALATCRQRIAAEDASLAHERTLTGDLQADLATTTTRLSDLNIRLAELTAAVAAAAENARSVEATQIEGRDRLAALQQSLSAVTARLAELQNQLQVDQADHLERMRQAARLHNEAASRRAQLDTLGRERDRLRQKAEHASGILAHLSAELANLYMVDNDLQGRLNAARQALDAESAERERLRLQLEEISREAADQRAMRTGLANRIEILENLEQAREGLGQGVREIMDLLQPAAPRPHGSPSDGTAWSIDWCFGLVADLLTVEREHATLIEIALAERAQYFVVTDGNRLAQALAAKKQPPRGRVSFMALDHPLPASHAPFDELPAGLRQLIVARAADVVSCQHPSLADLPERLLGKTLLVRDLDTAKALASHLTDCRLLTLAGEIVEADGTITVGSHHGESGIVSRKSELRELRQRIHGLDQLLATIDARATQVRQRLIDLDSRIDHSRTVAEALTAQAAELHSRLGQHRGRHAELEDEASLSRQEIDSIERDMAVHTEASALAQQQAEAADAELGLLRVRIETAEAEWRGLEARRNERQQEVTSAQVGAAQIDERLNALRARLRQLESDQLQRHAERDQGQRHLREARRRLDESQQSMLRATANLADFYLDKEASESRVERLIAEREVIRRERHALGEQVQKIRHLWREQSEQTHARGLAVNDLQHRRLTLVERMREDYQIELEALHAESLSTLSVIQASTTGTSEDASPGHAPSEETRAQRPQDITGLDLTAVNEEIAELRRKLGRLGSVNLDSLDELTELQTRAETLQTQLNDLVAAQRSLVEIIESINNDSRRLFSETLTTIRGHFQDLFRKLFGGGMADIVLEDESDILESGIEINARPPGKELRSISLLSGGEKTLTAVALLLAIFRSRPSPFCILDEVDAALDEANIARFTAVLREFLDQSQFIIITHSKKTMAVADVLYGITMQESGVSKRVAVRFEDWTDAEPANGAVAVKHAPIGQDDGPIMAGRHAGTDLPSAES